MWSASGSPADHPRTDGRSAVKWAAAVYETMQSAWAASRSAALRGSVPRAYGRGRRPIARRSARVPSDTPISASSPTAWTAVVTTGTGVERGLRTGAAGARVGVPSGCGGWGRRLTCRRVAGPAVAGLRVAAFRVVCLRGAVAVLVCLRGVVAGPFCGRAGAASRAGRLSLRRCGRVWGSAPRTFLEGSSVILLTEVAPDLKRLAALDVNLSYKNAERRPSGASCGPRR